MSSSENKQLIVFPPVAFSHYILDFNAELNSTKCCLIRASL